MTRKRFVIIGNGVAGISTAQEARECDPNAEIILIGNESLPYYYRASLTEWITGELNDENILGRTADFYDARHITQIQGQVQKIDPEAHQVQMDSGEKLPYDALCLATGAESRLIHLEGMDDLKIQTYRTLDDARQLKAAIKPDSRILILGAGVLGLELAGGLQRMGVRDVALVQILDYVGGPVLDKPAAHWLEKLIRADGYTIFLEDTIERIQDQTAQMKSGAYWDFDILVEAVGVTPTFPEVPGLKAGRGVRIDINSRTNLPDIFACGDCTETYDKNADRWFTTRIWFDCARQGRAAGASMAGAERPYEKTTFFNCSLIYNQVYSYIGNPHGEDGQVVRYQTEQAYRKIRLVDGRLAGALLVGSRHGTTAIFHAMGQDVSDCFEKDINVLADPAFDWNALTEHDWDYRFY